MSGRYEILAKATKIPGVRTVSVFSTEVRSKLWSTDAGESTIEESVVAAAIDMTEAVQRMLALADPGSLMEEILAVDPTWFHVLYLVIDQASGEQVVHILLDRRTANLAQARREFRAVVEAELAVRRAPQSPAGEVRADPRTTPNATTPTGLPRRVPRAPAAPEAPTGDEASHRAPSWMDHLARPFAADVPTLHGVLEGLRRL